MADNELSADELDIVAYTRPPRLDSATAITLVRQLDSASLSRPPVGVKRAQERMVDSGTTLEAAFRQRDVAARAADPRPVDQAADNSWSCLFRRLEALAELPHDLYEEARQAAEMQEELFSTGLAFLQLDYVSQWAESHKRLARIKENKRKPLLDKLCGPMFLAEVERTHKAYGEMLGIGTPKPTLAPVPSLSEPLRSVNQAIGAYALQLVALHQSPDSSGTLRAQIRAALRPLDDLREAQLRRAGERPSPADPVEPVEPVAPSDGGGVEPTP